MNSSKAWNAKLEAARFLPSKNLYKQCVMSSPTLKSHMSAFGYNPITYRYLFSRVDVSPAIDFTLSNL